MSKKKGFKHYKFRYRYYKEMEQHYRELYEVALGELQFTRLQKDHIVSILDEVEVLIEKGVNKHLIKRVIEHGKIRDTLDISIHYDLIGKEKEGS